VQITQKWQGRQDEVFLRPRSGGRMEVCTLKKKIERKNENTAFARKLFTNNSFSQIMLFQSCVNYCFET